MNILQILPALQSGGVERGTLDIASALHKNGHGAYVASAGGRLVHRLQWLGAHHTTLPLDSKNPIVMFLNITRILKLIKKYQIDIIHVRSRAPAWSAYYAAKKAKIPMVATFHGVYNYHNRIKKWYNSVMTKGVHIIAVSEYIRDVLIKQYQVDHKKITVIHRGIDLQDFSQSHVRSQTMSDMVKMWNLPDDRPILMLPGRITRWKGHLLALDALSLLLKQIKAGQNQYSIASKEDTPNRLDMIFPPFHCLFVGDMDGADAYVREIMDKAETLGIASMIQFVGHLSDVPAGLMLADVVISASTDPEAFGRVTVEAQAMGRPVVAPAHGGALEQIEHGVNGWLFQPNNAEDFSRCLYEALILSPLKRKLFAVNARNNVENKFSLQQMSNQTLAFYDWILKKYKQDPSMSDVIKEE